MKGVLPLYLWVYIFFSGTLVPYLSFGQNLIPNPGFNTNAAETISLSSRTEPPDVDLPASIEFCAGDTLVLNAGISDVEYFWNDGSQSVSIAITKPGMYSVTVSNAYGTDFDSTMVTDIAVLPEVSLGDDITICPGQSVFLYPDNIAVDSWLWPDGSTISAYTISSSQTVIVQVSNECGIATDTMSVFVLPDVSTLDLGSDTALCPGELLSLLINIPDVDILWSDGSNNNQLNVSQPGIIYTTISNLCGTATDSIEVSLKDPVPPLNLGNDQSLCPGETIVISPELIDVEYLWQDGSSLSSITIKEPGLVILTVSNDCGFTSDTIEIVGSTEAPDVNLGDDVIACKGEVVTLSADVTGVVYVWQDGSTSSEFTTEASGTFILQASNACGSDTDTVVVEINGSLPTPFLGADTTLCEGTTIELYSNADTTTKVLWQDGSTDHVMLVNAPGQFILTESNSCGIVSDTVYVDYNYPPATFDLGPDTTLCPDQFIILTAPEVSGFISWQDGSNGSGMVADENQIYWLEISNACGTARDEIEITIDEKWPSLNLVPEILLCNGENFTLDVTQSFTATYLWSDGSTQPTLDIDVPGNYTVSISTECVLIEKVFPVSVGRDCRENVYIPNAFTPNNDGYNDFFTISVGEHLNPTSVTCAIFDTWGNCVFKSGEPDFKWNGTFKNADMRPGVYVYYIQIEYLRQGKLQTQKFSGDITLIH